MREIRPYGSVRGVRRKPYPYRDTLLPVRSTAAFDFYRFHTPSRRNPPRTSHPPALIAWQSPPFRAADWHRKAPLIAPRLRAQIGGIIGSGNGG